MRPSQKGRAEGLVFKEDGLDTYGQWIIGLDLAHAYPYKIQGVGTSDTEPRVIFKTEIR